MTILAPVAADITFDPVTHIYRRPDGLDVPSVTQVLSATGLSIDFEAIRSMSTRRAEAIDAKRDIGTAVHADCHALDDDDLEWTTVDERVLPYVEAWAAFRSNLQVRPTTRERLVFHPTLGYAGTLDGIFELSDGRRVLIDIKTGNPEASGCQFQTAAYLAAHRVEHPDDAIAARWGVHLTPGTRVPYRISEYTDWRDFGVFQAALTVYQNQAVRRGRRA